MCVTVSVDWFGGGGGGAQNYLKGMFFSMVIFVILYEMQISMFRDCIV